MRLTGTLRLQDLEQVPGDRLAFAVFVGREVELVGVLEQLLQLVDVALLVAGHDVVGLEAVVDVDAEAGPRLVLDLGRCVRGAVRQVADVTDRGLDDVVLAEDIRRWCGPWRATPTMTSFATLICSLCCCRDVARRGNGSATWRYHHPAASTAPRAGGCLGLGADARATRRLDPLPARTPVEDAVRAVACGQPRRSVGDRLDRGGRPRSSPVPAPAPSTLQEERCSTTATTTTTSGASPATGCSTPDDSATSSSSTAASSTRGASAWRRARTPTWPGATTRTGGRPWSSRRPRPATRRRWSGSTESPAAVRRCSR